MSAPSVVNWRRLRDEIRSVNANNGSRGPACRIIDGRTISNCQQLSATVSNVSNCQLERWPLVVGRIVTEQRTAQLELDHCVGAPRSARRFLSTVLEAWGLPFGVVERSELLVSELVSNAFLHGRGPIHLFVSAEQVPAESIRVEVSNVGDGHPSLRRSNRGELSGRGLQLVEDLAKGWGAASVDGHTVVWFEVDPDDS